MSKFNRHEWSKRRRANQKALAKAIRQHRRRSHLRLEARQLGEEKTSKLYGGIGCLMAHTMRKRNRQLSAAISDRNPLLEMLKKHGATSRGSRR